MDEVLDPQRWRGPQERQVVFKGDAGCRQRDGTCIENVQLSGLGFALPRGRAQVELLGWAARILRERRTELPCVRS